MTTNRPLRVFLCHSSNDKPAVRELYQKLRAETWIEPWLDEEELYPGQDWETEIEKAVESSDAVLVCLSNGSINKRGFVQKELRFALDVALEMPEETVFIIPLRLEECIPPRSLRDWQFADYFEGHRDRAFERLLVSLKRQADSKGLLLEQESSEKAKLANQYYQIRPEAKNEKNILTSDFIPPTQLTLDWITENKITLSNGMELMRVPAGKFLIGSINENKLAYDDELPQHTVDIPYDYWMARFPVTNKIYNEYCEAKNIKHPVSGWARKKDHPVVKVSWIDAIAYCEWLNDLIKPELPSNLILRLPTETEWEKAARGTDRREYPWGDGFDKNKCNSSEGGKGGTTPVGLYFPHGDSPYGCADMSGNVWEWTYSQYKRYLYNLKDGYENENNKARVVRGGSYNDVGRNLRCARRVRCHPNEVWPNQGFRFCV